jgi:O-6-methylguanine DNA methyltransferase
MRKEDVKSEKDVLEYLEGWSDFEKDVYIATFRIPEGRVCTYGMIAKAIGRPRACRAVANALHNNPLYPVVPCWRVVKSDGGFGGDKRAAAGRRRRVMDEDVPVMNGCVIMSEGVLFRPRDLR